MNVSSAGLSSSWTTQKPDSTQIAADVAMLKQQAQTEEGVVALVEAAAEAPKTPAPPPPGQGRHVDVQA